MESSITLEMNNKESGGSLRAIASKSHAHRLLIAGALTLLQDKEPIHIICNETSADIEATCFCLKGLGIDIKTVEDGFLLSTSSEYTSEGISENPAESTSLLDAGESGSTLRFMLPVIGMLGRNAAITTHGRLTERPLSPLYEEMVSHGVSLSPQGSNPLMISGKMSGGDFRIAGNISSQYITGLLFALPLGECDSRILIEGPLASRPYVDITLDVLSLAGIRVKLIENPELLKNEPDISMIFEIPGAQTYSLPKECTVEGDWSNAAFFLAAGAIKNSVTVEKLNLASKQGDMAILDLLQKFGAEVTFKPSVTGKTTDNADNTKTDQSRLSDVTVTHKPLHGIEIDAENIPDLVPILSLTASLAEGTTVIRNIERLRIKESDRVATVIDTLTKLGADIREEDKALVIRGKNILNGGTVDSFNDHRIAMTAGIASLRCLNPVTITNEKAVNKSYPKYFEDLHSLEAGK
ncbi:3-phosphoshikimate 1-carboxyvinyltransferase [Eubacterium ruminantium]|nr:3-phosphoshikimate 1-carboxyvinyltransferase [Eubacterium ruminantium]